MQHDIAAIQALDTFGDGWRAVKPRSPVREQRDSCIIGYELRHGWRVDPSGFRRLEDQLRRHPQPAGNVVVGKPHRQHRGREAVPGGDFDGPRLLDGLHLAGSGRLLRQECLQSGRQAVLRCAQDGLAVAPLLWTGFASCDRTPMALCHAAIRRCRCSGSPPAAWVAAACTALLIWSGLLWNASRNVAYSTTVCPMDMNHLHAAFATFAQTPRLTRRPVAASSQASNIRRDHAPTGRRR